MIKAINDVHNTAKGGAALGLTGLRIECSKRNSNRFQLNQKEIKKMMSSRPQIISFYSYQPRVALAIKREDKIEILKNTVRGHLSVSFHSFLKCSLW